MVNCTASVNRQILPVVHVFPFVSFSHRLVFQLLSLRVERRYIINYTCVLSVCIFPPCFSPFSLSVLPSFQYLRRT